MANNSNENNNVPQYQESSVPTSAYENFAPMAANEALGGGGGFGGSNW